MQVQTTTQKAPLEHFLSTLRSRRVVPFVRNKKVLDFGCGEGMWNLRAIARHTASASGVDLVFARRGAFKTDEGIQIYPNLDAIPDSSFDVVTALACFEHIEVADLPGILQSLARVTTPDGMIVGTFPSPASKPVLEFMAYTLKIIDESQIRDHRVYYSPEHFAEVVSKGGWKLHKHSMFQFGFNTSFELVKAR